MCGATEILLCTYEGDALDGLAQAHLVGQDAVVVLHPGVDEPVEALQLVVPQRARPQEVRLLQQRPLRLRVPPLRLQPPHGLHLYALVPLLRTHVREALTCLAQAELASFRKGQSTHFGCFK